jgi:hypothetical protein
MFRFLENYWERTGKPDEIGNLLGGLSREIWADGEPGDPGAWEDWLEAVREVTSR